MSSSESGESEAVLSPAEVAACEQRLDVLSLLRGLGLASLPPCDEGSSEEEEEGGRNDEGGGGGGGGRGERSMRRRVSLSALLSWPRQTLVRLVNADNVHKVEGVQREREGERERRRE